MWPLLITSIVALTTVIERILFRVREHFRRDPDVVENIFSQVEKGNINAAIRAGEGSNDYIARIVVYGLTHREKSLSNAYLKAANQELQRFNRGLPILDTIITLAPLLGLLGTVTGLIRAFGLLGAQELGSPMAITGGIAEALIATAFGLAIAITALIPFNYLNARLEEARNVVQDAGSQLELLLGQGGGAATGSGGSSMRSLGLANECSFTQFPQASTHRDHSAHRHHVLPARNVSDGIPQHDQEPRCAGESAGGGDQCPPRAEGLRHH
jgi:biopolymer transport protein ExbB